MTGLSVMRVRRLSAWAALALLAPVLAEAQSVAAVRSRNTGPVPDAQPPASPGLVAAQREDMLRQISDVYALQHGVAARPRAAYAPVAYLNAELARRGFGWRVRAIVAGRPAIYELRCASGSRRHRCTSARGGARPS